VPERRPVELDRGGLARRSAVDAWHSFTNEPKNRLFFRKSYDLFPKGRFRLGIALPLQGSEGAPFMTSDHLSARDRKLTVSDAARLAPWCRLSWCVFVPAVFVGNVGLATFAWFVVELIMKLM